MQTCHSNMARRHFPTLRRWSLFVRDPGQMGIAGQVQADRPAGRPERVLRRAAAEAGAVRSAVV